MPIRCSASAKRRGPRIKGLTGSPEKTAQYREVGQENITALKRRVADFFTFALLECLEHQPRREPLELGTLLCLYVAARQPHAANAGIHLGLDGPLYPCTLVGDGQLIEGCSPTQQPELMPVYLIPRGSTAPRPSLQVV